MFLFYSNAKCLLMCLIWDLTQNMVDLYIYRANIIWSHDSKLSQTVLQNGSRKKRITKYITCNSTGNHDAGYSESKNFVTSGEATKSHLAQDKDHLSTIYPIEKYWKKFLRKYKIIRNTQKLYKNGHTIYRKPTKLNKTTDRNG